MAVPIPQRIHRGERDVVITWAEETAAAYLAQRLLGASGPAAERD